MARRGPEACSGGRRGIGGVSATLARVVVVGHVLLVVAGPVAPFPRCPCGQRRLPGQPRTAAAAAAPQGPGSSRAGPAASGPPAASSPLAAAIVAGGRHPTTTRAAARAATRTHAASRIGLLPFKCESAGFAEEVVVMAFRDTQSFRGVAHVNGGGLDQSLGNNHSPKRITN